MAKPIQPTPVLRGEAAKEFFKEMSSPASPDAVKFIKESKEVYKKYKESSKETEF